MSAVCDIGLQIFTDRPSSTCLCHLYKSPTAPADLVIRSKYQRWCHQPVTSTLSENTVPRLIEEIVTHKGKKTEAIKECCLSQTRKQKRESVLGSDYQSGLCIKKCFKKYHIKLWFFFLFLHHSKPMISKFMNICHSELHVYSETMIEREPVS